MLDPELHHVTLTVESEATVSPLKVFHLVTRPLVTSSPSLSTTSSEIQFSSDPVSGVAIAPYHLPSEVAWMLI